MAVSDGHLDPLFGASVPAADLYSLHVQSYTTSGSGVLERISSLTAVVVGPNYFEGATLPSAMYTVSAVNDGENTVTLTPGSTISTTPGFFQPSYALGYEPRAILLSTLPSFNIALGLDFHISQDVSLQIFSEEPLATGAVVTFSVGGSFTDPVTIVCFRAGTRIATEAGETAIEDLRPGDLIRTRFADLAPVEWLGRRSVDCRRHPQPREAWPVQIVAGAFGDDRPHRDLWLSPNHAVFAEDVLIPVKYLVNDTTIRQVPMDEVTYYHVELPRHDIVLAENLAAESYLDTGNRSDFANGGKTVALHPLTRSLTWEAEGCARLVVTGPTLEAVRRGLSERASAIGGDADRSFTATRVRR